MNAILHIYSNGDLIEVKVKENLILGIVRYKGPAQTPLVQRFDDLTSSEKHKVIDEFSKRNEPANEE